MAKTAQSDEAGAEAPVRKNPILKLSTRVEECDVVEVDGEEYDVLGFKHLSDEDESQVMATLARYDHLSMQLVSTGDDREAVSLARKLRTKRIDLLTRLTTIPAEVVSSLPPTEQIKLVRAVQSSAGLSADDEGAS